MTILVGGQLRRHGREEHANAYSTSEELRPQSPQNIVHVLNAYQQRLYLENTCWSGKGSCSLQIEVRSTMVKFADTCT